MKILITGGCGFLGSNLAHEAILRGAKVMLFDNLSRIGSDINLNWLRKQGNLDFVHGDIRNQKDVSTIVKSYLPDIIFHLAGQVAMTTSITNPRNDFETNVLGSLNVLESVKDYSPNSIILYSSSNKVYGDLEQYKYEETSMRYNCIEKPNGFTEETQLNFNSPYGCSKGAADQYMIDYSRIYGLKTVVFRHSSMYGGRQFSTYDQGWIGWFCQKAIDLKNNKNTEISISGNGKQVRDVIHSDDIRKLYFNTIENITSAKGNAFNIGGGINNSLSILELFKILEEITQNEIKFNILPARQSDQKVFVADITKAKKMLKWQPEVAPLNGIKKMIDWIKKGI